MPRQELTPNFRMVGSGAAKGEVLIPLVQSALWNPDFKGFNIEVSGFDQREPDGWFHPSTHPRMTERQLYHYLADPGVWVNEPFDPQSTMAVTQGKFWHDFIEHILVEMGVLIGHDDPRAEQVIAAGGVPVLDTKGEWAFSHFATLVRGAVDGLLDAEVFEFKTMMGAKARRIEQGAPDDPAVVASYREVAPDYYDQGIEYMRISGYRRHRSLIQSLEYPFPMREIVIDYDEHRAHEIASKYTRVIEAVDQGLTLDPCCSPKSAMAKVCPARNVCPVGLIR